MHLEFLITPKVIYTNVKMLRIMVETFNHKYLEIRTLLLYISFTFVSDLQLCVKIF